LFIFKSGSKDTKIPFFYLFVRRFL